MVIVEISARKNFKKLSALGNLKHLSYKYPYVCTIHTMSFRIIFSVGTFALSVSIKFKANVRVFLVYLSLVQFFLSLVER